MAAVLATCSQQKTSPPGMLELPTKTSTRIDEPKQLRSRANRLLVYRACLPLVAMAARTLQVVIVICSTVRLGNDVICTRGRRRSAGALNTHHSNHAVWVSPNNHLAVQFPLSAVAA